jgi:hypothetical protein
MIFCIVILLSITAAHLYGVLFLKGAMSGTAAAKAAAAVPPFYLQPFVWTLAVAAIGLAGLVAFMARR